MRFAALAASLALALALPAAAQAPPKQEPLKKGVNDIVLPEGKYYLEIPNDYDPRKPRPVIVFLHGKTVDLKADNAIGQLSNDFVMKMKRKGYIAMAPVMPPEHRPHWFENGESFMFMEAVMTDLFKKVNVQYVVCSGFSAGSNYTMHYGQHRTYHGWFSGYLVMAGGGFVDKGAPDDIKKKPIWLGCGDVDNDQYDDKTNTTGGARLTKDDLKANGYDSYYDEFPKVGHVMDKKMVDKAMEFVEANEANFAAIGAYLQAGKIRDDNPGKALLLLEMAAATKGKVNEYWTKKLTDGTTAMVERGKKAIAAAVAESDDAKRKDALTKLGQAWVGTSVEKLVKDAMGAKK
ncbi:MAG: hypothetical protein K8T20_17905 [Planctomycetes bacterium]|nr:hypothetical protein [Planctomycetota bacterium]